MAKVIKTKISTDLVICKAIIEVVATLPIVEVIVPVMMFVSLAPCLIIISTTFYPSPRTLRAHTRLLRWKGRRMVMRVRIIRVTPF